MKVLIISSGFFPVTELQGGAIERLVENYLDYNEYIKDEIIVYSVKTNKNSYDKKTYKYTQFRIIDKTKISFKLRRAFYGILNKVVKKYVANAYIRTVINDLKSKKELNKYDKIIFENGQDFIPYFKKKTNTQSDIVLHLHNDYLNTKTSNGKEIFDCCYEIWTVSNFIKSAVDELSDKGTNKVKVLYNAVDTKLFSKKITENEKKNLKRKIGIKNEFIYLYVGRLMPGKGVYELITAFNNLNKKHVNIKLIIIGGGISLNNKDPYIEKLRNLKDSNNNIVFTGFVNAKELYKYYQIANVQIIPSLCNEAFGLIVLEGIISNLPIIASNIGGIPEVIGNNCVYVNTNNIVPELEQKMEKMLLKQYDSNELTKGYEDIKNKFTLEKYCKNFEDLLKKRYD